jgi:hypothetical protein
MQALDQGHHGETLSLPVGALGDLRLHSRTTDSCEDLISFTSPEITLSVVRVKTLISFTSREIKLVLFRTEGEREKWNITTSICF